MNKLLQKTYNSGNTINEKEFPLKLLNQKGELIDEKFDIILQPTFDDNNEVDGVLWFEFNVTELVNARNIAQQNQIRYWNLMDSMDDGFFELDKQWKYINVNNQGVKFSNKTREELLGKSIFDSVPEFKNSAFHKAASLAMDKNQTSHIEAYFASQNKWYDTTYYPIDRGITFFCRDITERKFSEANFNFLSEASKVLSSSLEY